MTALNDIRLDLNWLDENQNAKSKETFLNQVITYVSKGSGAKKTLKVIQKIALILTQLGVQSQCLMRLVTSIGAIGSGLGITRLPSTARQSIRSIAALADISDGATFCLKGAEAVRSSLDLISGVGEVVGFVAANSTASAVGQTVGLVSDCVALPLTMRNYIKASRLEAKAEEEGIKKVLSHSKKYYMLRVIQEVVAVAVRIFGGVALAIGTPMVPALISISVSLSILVLSIAITFFKNQGRYKVVKFDKPVTLC